MKTAAALVGCSLLMACSMEAGAPGDFDQELAEADIEEQVGSVQSAVLPWFSGPHTVSVSEGVRESRLLPTSTHVCALTRVSGKFMSDAEQVRLIRSNGEWVLQAFSGGAGASGEAHCYRRDAFTSNDSTTSLSSQQSVNPWTRDISDHGCSRNDADAWSGSAFTFINGIGGELAGSGEWVRINQSTVDTLPSTVEAQICARDEEVIGSSHSFRAGPIYDRIATFYTNDDHWGDATVPTTVFSASGNQTVVMAKSKFTMCALTQIQGGFFGGGESVQIRNEVVDGYERWVLRTKKGAASDHVSAKARCYARVQTT